jgi:hypothetical protein
MKSKYNQTIIEIIIWLAFLGFPLLIFPTFMPFITNGSIHPAFIGIMITHSLLIAFYYFNFYFAIPKFYFTKKYSIYKLVLVSCALVILGILFTDPSFNPFPNPPFRYVKIVFALSILLRFLMIFLLSLGFANIRRLQQIENEKLSTELAYLKAQINPHFLFNTLNSIYALTFMKSDKAPESITRLSDIMRYVITEAAQDTVPLEKEIHYLNSYISLEKLRLTEKVKLDYSVTGAITNQRIAPLIFIALIENAFKYGVSTSENSTISISVDINNYELTLNVFNNKLRYKQNGSGGLGIANLKRRLNLLYSGKHSLTLSEDDKGFTANLMLQLDDKLHSHR